jgi:hypothetical protein
MPGLRLIVSFADTGQGHHGGIYQACGWVYIGAARGRATRVLGINHHPKTLHSRYGYGGQSIPWLRRHVDPFADNVMLPDKLKYALPLDCAMRAQIAPLAKPYPKRATSIVADAPAIHAGEDGSTPIVALQRSAAD